MRVVVLGGITLCAFAMASALAASPLETGRTSQGRRLFEGGDRPLRLGATPAGLADTEAATCATCHAEIAAEWRGSLHAQAWTDPVFQASYAKEPLSFCRDCHAPLNRGPNVGGVAARDGISCAVCHVRDGHILGTRGGPAPHPVKVEPRLGTSDFCAPCHEFGFHAGNVETAELQQSTVTEWRHRYDAGATTQQCQGCHMPTSPTRGAHKVHGFAASRDPDTLRAAADLTVRVAGTTLFATFVPKLDGHSFPTGDLFRRLELVVWREGEAKTLTLAYTRSYGNRPLAGGKTTRFEKADTRVGEGELTRTLDLGTLGPGPWRWRLDYLLMPASVAEKNGIGKATNVLTIREGVVAAE